ncbi:MAG: response regulator [Spirochaetales bacterium]|nr:response regulator [Spirochaetales bacterium]
MPAPKILVIDDKPDNLCALRATLEEWIPDAVILTVLSGMEGIERAERDLPDAVLTDILMPGIDGYEVCSRLKAGHRTRHIPVILLTASITDVKQRVKGMGAGADAFVTKPIDGAELTAQIRVALRVKAAADELRTHREHLQNLVEEKDREIVRAEMECRGVEEALRESESRLAQAQKMETIGRLTGGVVHDLNNTLTIVGGYAEIILEDPDPSETVHEGAGEIKRASRRAASLIRQLLDFSRKHVPSRGEININEHISDVEGMLQKMIGEDVLLQSRLQPGIALIEVDPVQLTQLLMNLALNARDAMPDGGRLTIETGNFHLDTARAEEHKKMRPGDYVMLSVTDVGSGMDARTKEKIFEPFFTTKGPGIGTGLGLSNVQTTVERSGGYVSVHSEINRGTEFRIYFPQIRAEESSNSNQCQDDSDAAVQDIPRGNETILVVDDEDSVRSIERTILEKLGYTVREASSGEQVFQMYQSGNLDQIHLLMTDVNMPETSGFELAQALRGSFQGLKVLYVSGYAEDIIVRRGAPRNGELFLSKPFSPGALATKVREALDGA